MLQVAFGSTSLTTFNSGSHYINHPTQPSASSGCNSRNQTKLLTEFDLPRKVATLSERLAPHRYQWRTAPRLRGAEPSVLLNLLRDSRTITYAAFAAKASFPMFRVSYPHEMPVPKVLTHNARLVSHAWEAAVLPLNYTRLV